MCLRVLTDAHGRFTPVIQPVSQVQTIQLLPGYVHAEKVRLGGVLTFQAQRFGDADGRSAGYHFFCGSSIALVTP
jgi:hypothetical protein